MQACQHRSFECIQVSYRNINKCITNFNRLTTVAHVIDALLDDLCEKRHLTINDCCLYVERTPYVFPLKPTEFIQDILLRYASSNIHFKLSFKRNASPSRFAQRKRILRTPVRSPPSPTETIPNAFEQLKIQESLIRRQHQIITQLTKSNNYTQMKTSTANYANYFDWVTHNDEESDDSRMSSDSIPVCRRQSRQDEYHRAISREPTSRSLSRVRFAESNEEILPPCSLKKKSILKKVSSNYPILPRTSSVDRDIAILTSIPQTRTTSCTIDDTDDENLSDQSTTDSCLGSLSSDDNNSYVITQHQLETLV